MRKLLTALLVQVAVLCHINAQAPAEPMVIQEKDGAVFYEEVVQVDGATQEELYNRAKIWFAETFRSAKEVIQLDNKEEGKIIGKGVSSFIVNAGTAIESDIPLYFTIDLQMKDGRYKILFSNMRTHVAAIEMWISEKRRLNKKGEVRSNLNGKYYQGVNQELNRMADSLEAAMKTTSSNTTATGSEW